MTKLEKLLQPVIGFIQIGMLEDAWEELESLPPDLRVNDEVLAKRIEILQLLGKWESARVLAESLARRCPENPQWWIQWAYSLRHEKSVEDGRKVLLEAAAIHPEEPLISHILTCYASMEGDADAAEEMLKRAFAHSSGGGNHPGIPGGTGEG